MSYVVAVVGATGNVGREILNILDERKFPLARLDCVASRKSQGREVSFGDRTLKAQALEFYDFSQADIALFACGSGPTKEYAPKAAKAGCIVIDNSSLYRMEDDVPLIVPEVNPEALAGYTQRNIIANPNCSTAQLMVALKPLHDVAKIKRLVVSTYQSVSGAGASAMDELFTQTRAVFVNDELKRENFTKQIAFNVIPHIDEFMKGGSTKEEWKMQVETQKILDPDIAMAVTCVRVPVFVGHSEAVTIEFESEISETQAYDALEAADGVLVVDRREDDGYVTPIECVGDYETFVSRLRVDPTVEHGLSIWVVSDNLRKGAALNAVQIAELLTQKHLTKSRVKLDA
ncbi:MAG: aspartate-semialdehyde dehydrogenase [Rhodobiaceae bacterium]|jgi:aspartate-semialdehyde dehydrogenase|nr:aspartate-semialdehyde dehydrogenase [Rhodobiaceae bacterium]